MSTTCEDCYAQVEPTDRYGHNLWHTDQAAGFDALLTRLKKVESLVFLGPEKTDTT